MQNDAGNSRRPPAAPPQRNSAAGSTAASNKQATLGGCRSDRSRRQGSERTLHASRRRLASCSRPSGAASARDSSWNSCSNKCSCRAEGRHAQRHERQQGCSWSGCAGRCSRTTPHRSGRRRCVVSRGAQGPAWQQWLQRLAREAPSAASTASQPPHLILVLHAVRQRHILDFGVQGGVDHLCVTAQHAAASGAAQCMAAEQAAASGAMPRPVLLPKHCCMRA